MSVTFRVQGAKTSGVEMANATARIVLRMLGRQAEGYLEGRMTVARLERDLASIDEATIRANVVPRRQIAPGWVDNGTSEEWLGSRIEGLRDLVRAAKALGKRQIVWR